jgi:hypothetical protein
MPRIYVSQSLLDRWIGNAAVELDGDLLRLQAGGLPATLYINPAVYFEHIDGRPDDPNDLVGTVKTAQDLGQIGAEHYDSSVVLGDEAYTVRPGFVAVPLGADGTETVLDAAAWMRLAASLMRLSM